MGVFTTREIAIFIYAILFFAYILTRKKGRAALLPVIKAACHKKLVIPFIIVLCYAAGFVWACTCLPFWNWVYVKDIAFWTLFVGVPVCFNATSRQLEERYFANILIDNLKFTALVEFVTGTFTFSIIGELLLQPLLVFFLILQSSLVEETDKVSKLVDRLVGVAGIAILGLTIKSAVDSFGEIQFADIAVGLLLPTVLSLLYIPVAYVFAVYAKYEILFIRMDFKEPHDEKLKRKHRIEVIRCCKLSYKKVCRFLREYVQRMYVKMASTEFEKIIDEFRGTTEHTYYAAIKYHGKYYVSRTLTKDAQFGFKEFTTSSGGLFRNSNKELRKEIALQIQSETAFKNMMDKGDRVCRSVSLKKVFMFNKTAFFRRTKIAIFRSDDVDNSTDTINLQFAANIRDQCDTTTLKLMRILKWNAIGPSIIAVFLYFISFILASLKSSDAAIDLDVVASVFAVISYLYMFLNSERFTKCKIFRKLSDLHDWLYIGGLLEVVVFLISCFVAVLLKPIETSSTILSKLGIAFIFLDAIINMVTRDQ